MAQSHQNNSPAQKKQHKQNEAREAMNEPTTKTSGENKPST
ncbi:hypothetical protein [Litoribacterium kuwaitense]|nr:hypothetical protein [Litoribacterium kuwaitense]